MIEALMLSVIAILQGYILTRIDSLDSRFDIMRDELRSAQYKLEYLMEHPPRAPNIQE